MAVPGAIAQLGERLDRTQEVGGSSPPSSIARSPRMQGVSAFWGSDGPRRRGTAVVLAIRFGLRNGRVEESEMASSVNKEGGLALRDLWPERVRHDIAEV